MRRPNRRALTESIYKSQFWAELGAVKGKFGFGFLAILAILSSFTAAISASNLLFAAETGIFPQLAEKIPEMRVEQGRLSIDQSEPSAITIMDDVKIVFNPEYVTEGKETSDIQSHMEAEGISVLFADYGFFVQSRTGNHIDKYLYDIEENYTITRQKVLDFIPAIRPWFVAVMVGFLIPVMFFYKLLQALLYSVVALGLNQIIVTRFEYPQIFRLTVFALYPAILFDFVFAFFGMVMPLFLSLLITAFYIAFGLKANQARV